MKLWNILGFELTCLQVRMLHLFIFDSYNYICLITTLSSISCPLLNALVKWETINIPLIYEYERIFKQNIFNSIHREKFEVLNNLSWRHFSILFSNTSNPGEGKGEKGAGNQ